MILEPRILQLITDYLVWP